MKTPQLYQQLEKALNKFAETADFPDTEPMRESTIHRFEYTFELSWKLMSSILKDQGIETQGMRNIVRAAGQLGLIEDVPLWLEFTNARNLTSHIYHENVAQKVYDTTQQSFHQQVELFLAKAKPYTSESNLA